MESIITQIMELSTFCVSADYADEVQDPWERKVRTAIDQLREEWPAHCLACGQMDDGTGCECVDRHVENFQLQQMFGGDTEGDTRPEELLEWLMDTRKLNTDNGE